MAIKVDIKELQQDAFLKLRCMISLTGSKDYFGESTSRAFIVNDLATVHLHFKDQFQAPGLICKILAKSESARVKVKVSCQEVDEPFYSEWICTNEWKIIGYKGICDIDLANVYTTLLNICISASKVEEPALAKLYKDFDFTDFNLRTGGATVPVHRALLAIQSDVFRAMLTREWKEKTEGNIQMEGVTLLTLQHFRDYMYLQILPDEGLKDLLLFALHYSIDDLKAECISKLTFNSKNWNGLLEFAVENQKVELVRTIMIVNPTFIMKEDHKDHVKK